RNIGSLKNFISPCRRKFRRTGLTIAGVRNGRAWLKRQISTNTSRGENRNGSSKLPSNFTRGLDFHRCRKVFGKSPIFIHFRQVRNERKTRTPPARTSI